MISLATPAILLAVVLAALYASAWTAWRARSWDEWPYYLLAALFGFSIGQWLGMVSDWQALAIGQLHLVPATLVSAIALWLAGRIRQRTKP